MGEGIRPLDGLLVVAMEHAVAGPFATRQLADMGARVIKIERPGTGDFARQYDASINGLSAFFAWVNRGKESVVLDVKEAGGRALLDRLLGNADVFLQNLAPGAAERLGLTHDALHDKHPSLICCEISGYGRGGPWSEKKAYDLLIQAAAGMPSVTGIPQAPARVGVSIADISAGMYAYSGILQALLQRHRTGKGVNVEVSMFESLSEWMSYPLYSAHYSGALPRRSGMSHAAIAPYGQFRTGDGKEIVFGLQNEREWARFCAVVMGDPALRHDPRFATNIMRARNREALERIIEREFEGMTLAEAVARLDEAAIANAPMNDMRGLWAHPQLTARERWREVDTPAGTMRALIPPATLSGVEPVMGRVPGLGEHTTAIFNEFAMTAEH